MKVAKQPKPPKLMLGETIGDMKSSIYWTVKEQRMNVSSPTAHPELRDLFQLKQKNIQKYSTASENQKQKMRKKLTKILSQSAMLQTTTNVSGLIQQRKDFKDLQQWEQECILTASEAMLIDAIDDIDYKKTTKERKYREECDKFNTSKQLPDDVDFATVLAEEGNHPNIYANKEDTDDGWYDVSGKFHKFDSPRPTHIKKSAEQLSDYDSMYGVGRRHGYGHNQSHTTYGGDYKGTSYYGRHSGCTALNKFKTPYAVRTGYSTYGKTQKELSEMKYFSKSPKLPLILVNPDVFRKMWALVDESSIEISWHCLFRRLNLEESNGTEDVYEIYDLLMFPQMNTAATTTTDDGDYQLWMDKIPDEQFNHLRCHCHSHVNMEPHPSGTDQQYRNNVMSQIENNEDFYLFMILNKKRKYTLSLYVLRDNCEYEQNDVVLFPGSYAEWEDTMLKAEKINIISCISKINAIVFGDNDAETLARINLFKSDIKAAREAYDKLTDSQKEFITNLAHLEEAENFLKMKEAYDNIVYCEGKINAIPTDITLAKDFSEQIIAARKVYDALPEDSRAGVENYKILTAAEAALNDLYEKEKILIDSSTEWAKSQIKVNVEEYGEQRRAKLNLTNPNTPAITGGADTATNPTVDTPTPSATTTPSSSTDNDNTNDSNNNASDKKKDLVDRNTRDPSDIIADPQLFLQRQISNCLAPNLLAAKQRKINSVVKHSLEEKPRLSWRDEILKSLSIKTEIFQSIPYGREWREFCKATDLDRFYINPALMRCQKSTLSSLREKLETITSAAGFDRIRNLTTEEFLLLLKEIRDNDYSITSPSSTAHVEVLPFSSELKNLSYVSQRLADAQGHIAGIIVTGIQEAFSKDDPEERAKTIAMRTADLPAEQKFSLLYTNYFVETLHLG